MEFHRRIRKFHSYLYDDIVHFEHTIDLKNEQQFQLNTRSTLRKNQIFCLLFTNIDSVRIYWQMIEHVRLSMNFHCRELNRHDNREELDKFQDTKLFEDLPYNLHQMFDHNIHYLYYTNRNPNLYELKSKFINFFISKFDALCMNLF